MTKQNIILGDSLAEMKKLESERFDLIVADPPYNLGKNYGNNHDDKGIDEYLAFSRSWLDESYSTLR